MVLESYNKPKNLHPSPESVQQSEWYTFNLNPKDIFQLFDENEIRRHHMFKDSFVKILKDFLSPYCNYVCNIEVSQSGRLHLHGKIQFKDLPSIVRFYLSSINHFISIGTTKIELIKDAQIKKKDKYKSWDEYMSKQTTMWQSINFDPVITSESVLTLLNLRDQLRAGLDANTDVIETKSIDDFFNIVSTVKQSKRFRAKPNKSTNST